MLDGSNFRLVASFVLCFVIFNRVLQFKQNCKSVLYFDALKMKSISLLMNIWARVTSSSEGVQAKDSAFWCFEH